MNAVSCMRGRQYPARFSVQGGAALPIIIIVLLLVAVAAGGWWYFSKQGAGDSGDGAAGLVLSPDDPGAGDVVDEDEIDATISQLSLDELYRAARIATGDNRIVTPPGNNAFEYYLSVLERVPGESAAIVALHELFPVATGAAEQEINQGELDRATRIIDLLTQADPESYTLTILRSKRDAKRRQMEREEQLELAAAAASARPQTTPAETAATEAEAAAAQQQAAATTAAATPAPAATPPVSTPSPPPVAEPARPAGETRGVVVTTPMAPEYPRQALRDRVQGWVEVEFVVTDAGAVQNVRVVDAQPRRVFDRAAMQAVSNATFLPELVAGQPVTSIERRRIEFKLGG